MKSKVLQHKIHNDINAVVPEERSCSSKSRGEVILTFFFNWIFFFFEEVEGVRTI